MPEAGVARGNLNQLAASHTCTDRCPKYSHSRPTATESPARASLRMGYNGGATAETVSERLAGLRGLRHQCQPHGLHIYRVQRVGPRQH